MDSGIVWVSVLSFATGWLIRGTFEPKPEAIPCACHCSCIHSGEASGNTGWGIYGILGLLLTVGIVLATNAVLAFRVTVRSLQGEQEVAVQVKDKSKGIYDATKGFQLTG